MSAPSWWAGRLESLHGRLVEEAYQRGLAEAKDLAEVAGRFGYELGRKEAGEEIAAALEAVPAEVYPEEFFPVDGTSVDCQSARVMRFAYPAAARIARDLTSQPSGAASEPRTDPGGYMDLPPKSDRPVHVMSCDDCRADLDVRDHYADCALAT